VNAARFDPRRLLEVPSVYNAFQKLFRADVARRRFAAEYLTPFVGGRVLEVGCGPGTNCEWMPKGIEYVGCDVNERYVAYARKRYSGLAEFHAAPVGKLSSLGLRPFRAVFAIALLHHISDEEILTLCDEVFGLLEKGGVFITGDPCYVDGQSRLERFVTSCDRGKFVRHPEEYRRLLAQRFAEVTARTATSATLIPQSGVALTAVKG
jgi:SAM-dependent methyltransferase